MDRKRALIALLVALCLLSFAAACGGGGDEDEDDDEGGAVAEEATGIKYTPTGNEATLTGAVAFNGTTPEPKPISMTADQVCASSNPNAVAEEVKVTDGKLQNVFVYVKDGKTADGKGFATLTFDPPSQPQVLDQKGCQYVPHVLGIQTRQKLTVLNSDPTAHNVNLQGKSNPGFNQSQPPGAGPIEKVFDRAEVLIPVKCNQHPWMKSYVGVLRHPFYAVTGADGRFEIKGLPPGTYTVVAWHEKFPEQTQTVTVAAKESKTQDFAFAGATALNETRGGSLTLMPAIEFPMLGAGGH